MFLEILAVNVLAAGIIIVSVTFIGDGCEVARRLEAKKDAPKKDEVKKEMTRVEAAKKEAVRMREIIARCDARKEAARNSSEPSSIPEPKKLL